MKAINVSELKAHLSEYLRLASRGARIIVKDRDEPVAQLGPVDKADKPWRERMAEAGRLRPGTQQWGALKISSLGRRVDIQQALRDGREDPREIRRR